MDLNLLAIILTCLIFALIMVWVVMDGWSKIYMFTKVTIVSCDDINQTKCLIISESRDKREIQLLEQRKSFSVENPSSNTA